MAKILVTGSDGRFGKILKKIENKHKLIFKGKKQLNIANLTYINYHRTIILTFQRKVMKIPVN